MKVKDLIRALQKLDGNLDVIVNDDVGGEVFTIAEADDVFAVNDEFDGCQAVIVVGQY